MYSVKAVILAAGASSRMGEPKQLLPFGKHSFIQQVNSVAAEVFGDDVLIILGAHAATLLETLPELAGYSVINKQWEKGMGSSISFAVSTILRSDPGTDGIIFLAADQPFITAKILSEMVAKLAENPDNIVAAAYEDVAGIPALFTKSFFNDLLALNGEQGAKKIIRAASDRVQLVHIDDAAIDIDTPEQYRSVIGKR